MHVQFIFWTSLWCMNKNYLNQRISQIWLLLYKIYLQIIYCCLTGHSAHCTCFYQIPFNVETKEKLTVCIQMPEISRKIPSEIFLTVFFCILQISKWWQILATCQDSHFPLIYATCTNPLCPFSLKIIPSV